MDHQISQKNSYSEVKYPYKINKDLLLDQFTSIKLNNGITICNFSSFHDYVFNTGEVLPACTKEVADRHKLLTRERPSSRWIGHSFAETSRYDNYMFEHYELDIDKPDWIDVELEMTIASHTLKDLKVLSEMNHLDIILVPYPLKDLLNQGWKKSHNGYIIWQKARTCRKVDPRDISKGIYSDKFCI